MGSRAHWRKRQRRNIVGDRDKDGRGKAVVVWTPARGATAGAIEAARGSGCVPEPQAQGKGRAAQLKRAARWRHATARLIEERV